MRFRPVPRICQFTLVFPSPFKYGSKVPTDEEVSRASENILDDLTIFAGQNPHQRNEVRRLLSDSVFLPPSELISDLAFVEHTHPEDFVVAEILFHNCVHPCQLVLTRGERQRVPGTSAGLFGQLVPVSPRGSTEPGGAGTQPISDAGESIFEELEFNSQTPQGNFAELEHLGLGGYEGEDEEEFMTTPTKKRRLGDFSPVIDPCFGSLLLSPNKCKVPYPIPSLTPVSSSPRRVQHLNDVGLPQPPLVLQNPQILPDTTSQSRDLVHSNLSGTVHQTAASPTDRIIKPSPAPVLGRGRDFDEFLALRGVHLNEPPATRTTETAVDSSRTTEVPSAPQRTVTEVPPDLIDKNTIQVPVVDSLPVSRHQYLASLDLLQKHALCRCLSDAPAAIDLTEREFLGGVDLILDQDTAILFLSLSALPSECEGLITGISDISWRYSHILIVFEAFLVSQAFGNGEESRIASFVFTEPIVKSVKKLRRSLMIAEGVGTKTEDCVVSWAFAKNIEEAARLARVYGDMAENRDATEGLLWQERWWLGERDAEDLALFEFEVRPSAGSRELPLFHGTFRTKVISPWFRE